MPEIHREPGTDGEIEAVVVELRHAVAGAFLEEHAGDADRPGRGDRRRQWSLGIRDEVEVDVVGREGMARRVQVAERGDLANGTEGNGRNREQRAGAACWQVRWF